MLSPSLLLLILCHEHTFEGIVTGKSSSMRRLKRHVKHGIVALNDHNAKDETKRQTTNTTIERQHAVLKYMSIRKYGW